MRGQYPCGGLGRRDFMGTAAFSMLGATAVSAQEPGDRTVGATRGGTLWGRLRRGILGLGKPIED